MSAAISDLSRVRDEAGEVLAVEALGGGLVEIAARLPHLAAQARPGEFAQLRCGAGIEPLLRRPFSVAWTDGERCGFVLEAVGVGTRILVALRPGDPLQALGPLGSGFSFEPTPARALVVSGGLGCAPFPLLIRELRRGGCPEVVVLNGAATASRLYPADRFQRGDRGVVVAEATEDGSRGHHGLVTDLVADRCDETTLVYGCGPNPMLAALAEVLLCVPRPPLRAEVSLEAPMGCGFGTCLGCALPVVADPSSWAGGEPAMADGDGAAIRSGRGSSTGRRPAAWALCCRQGPVMEVSRVAWPELLALPPAHIA
ncbi:MAG TPA: dihydroorotate dehydrogenase electron transfer subunit [Candidatus Binatia bacterium]|nr:dihydroorotate dehydrogenase electron transfer subunit [Candidatus Binatia bacterium]